jgi:hypothetical protein
MSLLSNDELIATLGSPSALYSAVISPAASATSPSGSWSQISSGSGTLRGGLKLYKVFATNKSGCQTLCQHNVGKDGGRKSVSRQLYPMRRHAEQDTTENFVPLDPNFLYVIFQKTPKLTIFQ